MSYLVDPAQCPNCQEPLQLTYAERRYTRLQPLTMVLRALIVLMVAMLIPVLLLISRATIAYATEETALHWRERGLLFLILYGVSLAGLWLLTRMGWRYTRSLPHRTRTTCQACGWSGPCLVREAWM
jgi:hypothetical protein